MPRPRRDSEILPAKERLENAFWTLLADRDFSKITVTDIVHEAQVNRNSFYYHFSGLPELADSAIMHEVERLPLMDIPTPTSDPDVAWHRFCSTLLHTPANVQLLDRLSLLTSDTSTDELLESLRDFLRLTMYSQIDRTPSTADTKTQILVTFTVGGILSTLYSWPAIRTQTSSLNLMDRDIAILATGLMLAMSGQDTTKYWHHLYLDSARIGAPHDADAGADAEADAEADEDLTALSI